MQVWVGTQAIQDKTRGRAIVAGTNDVTVTNNKEQFTLVIELVLRERVNCAANRILVFSIDGDLTDDELIMVFWPTRGSERESSDVLEPNDSHHHRLHSHQDIGVKQTLCRIT